MIRQVWALPLLLTTACASAPPAAPPVPAAHPLVYAMPATPAATYAFSDSSGYEIQTGAMGAIRVSISSAGTANITYAMNAGALQGTVHVAELNASMGSSQGGEQTASQADIQGDAVVSITGRGSPTVVSMPKVSEAAQRAGISEGFFRRLFVHLPGSVVQPGSVWVDTVATTDEAGGIKASVHDVVTSTLAADTIVAGKTLAHITTTTQRTLNISGQSQGTEIVQKLSGTTTGYVLWDRDRNLLVERYETTALKGTFDLPQMGMTGLPVDAHGTDRVSLR